MNDAEFKEAIAVPVLSRSALRRWKRQWDGRAETPADFYARVTAYMTKTRAGASSPGARALSPVAIGTKPKGDRLTR